MNKLTHVLWFCLAFSLVFVSFAQAQAQPAGKPPLKIVATVGMVGDIVREVAGDRAVVTTLMGPGVDPHLYKPTRDDVVALQRADAVFYSGLMLEGKMIEVLVRIGRNKPVFAVTENIDPKYLLAHSEDDKPSEGLYQHDPHVWMDLSVWAKCVDVVATSLTKVEPQHAELFAQRAKDYVAKCNELHTYGIKALASIPASSRVLISSHDAFAYFGRAYGLEVMGVQGISTESEAGLQRINQLVDFIVSRGVKAVFVESTVPQKSIQALIEGAKSRGHTLVIGGELYSDAMGEAGTPEGTYLGMLEHNIKTVTTALGGTLPQRGSTPASEAPAAGTPQVPAALPSAPASPK
jgi:manganese/zinc/iron transport system substrate-binding protein